MFGVIQETGKILNKKALKNISKQDYISFGEHSSIEKHFSFSLKNIHIGIYQITNSNVMVKTFLVISIKSYTEVNAKFEAI